MIEQRQPPTVRATTLAATPVGRPDFKPYQYRGNDTDTLEHTYLRVPLEKPRREGNRGKARK